jgi:hypothetical protein
MKMATCGTRWVSSVLEHTGDLQHPEDTRERLKRTPASDEGGDRGQETKRRGVLTSTAKVTHPKTSAVVKVWVLYDGKSGQYRWPFAVSSFSGASCQVTAVYTAAESLAFCS